MKEEDESGRLGRFARRFTVADQAGQSAAETAQHIQAQEQQKTRPTAAGQTQQSTPPAQQEADFDFADLLNVGGELQAVDQKQIARPDRSGKKKKGKR